MVLHILKIDLGGVPVEWLRWEEAATLYARERVRWEAGEARFRLHGGLRGDGSRSSLEISSIIAVGDRSRRFERGRPMVHNRILFARDGYVWAVSNPKCNRSVIGDVAWGFVTSS